MKIIHEREKCLGCGLCTTICPQHWEMADDGKSRLLNSNKNKDGNYELELEDVGCSQEAAESCPVQCIRII